MPAISVQTYEKVEYHSTFPACNIPQCQIQRNTTAKARSSYDWDATPLKTRSTT
jgi:hypothetical protein